MIPDNMPLFKFIRALYQFHHQTLPIMKIDRGQIQFRDYVFTGTEPSAYVHRISSKSQGFPVFHFSIRVLSTLFASYFLFLLHSAPSEVSTVLFFHGTAPLKVFQSILNQNFTLTGKDA